MTYTYYLWCWWLVLLLFNTVLTTLADVCLSRHFHDIRGNEVDDYIIYGLTQDCQIFFIRPSQIPLLSTINVNVHNSYCYPNLVQLHVKSHNTLLLLTKQAGNRICTLELQIPPTEMLFGDHLFSYSLLSSLPYASCSHSSPKMFRLEPDLSFLDTVFSDVLYFIDAESTGALWTVHQFQINSEGFLRHLEKISINNHAKPLEVWTGPDLASEYVVTLDNQRNFIYIRNRFERNLLYECSYDLLFRPNTLVPHYVNTSSREERPWLNSMAADQNVLLYTETDRTVKPAVTRLFGLNIDKPSFGRCLVYTDYAFDVGVMRTSTLKFMEQNPLPTFEFSRRLNSTLATDTSSAKNRVATPSYLPRPSTYHTKSPTTSKKSPKLTTIYMTSTEKVVTSAEFRLAEELVEWSTELPKSAMTSIEMEMANVEWSTQLPKSASTSMEIDQSTSHSIELEKAKILERDNDGIGLMTTTTSKSEEELELIRMAPNMSSVGDLRNQTSALADSLHWKVLPALYCVYVFVLE
ncbi:hypothetical protein V3C99_006877 [Haemonchus contortus]